MNFEKLLTLGFGKNAGSDIHFSSLSLEFKISLRTAFRNLTCIATVSEIARLRTHCINAKCAESTFGCLCNFEQYAAPGFEKNSR